MVLFFATVILLLIVLAVLRLNIHQTAEATFRYEIFALRDRLRRLAVEGRIEKDSFIFDFLDRSFSVAVQRTHYITFWHIRKLSKFHEGNAELARLGERVRTDVARSEALYCLMEDYAAATQRYLIRQHVLTPLFVRPFMALSNKADAIARRVRREVSASLTYPEISASGKYLETAQTHASMQKRNARKRVQA